MKTLKDLGVPAEMKMRLAADQRPLVEGAKDTPEITLVDPDGVVVTIADWRNAGGVGPSGSIILMAIYQAAAPNGILPAAQTTAAVLSYGACDEIHGYRIERRSFAALRLRTQANRCAA